MRVLAFDRRIVGVVVVPVVVPVRVLVLGALVGVRVGVALGQLQRDARGAEACRRERADAPRALAHRPRDRGPDEGRRGEHGSVGAAPTARCARRYRRRLAP